MIKIKSLKMLKKNELIINGSYKLEHFEKIAGKLIDSCEIDGIWCYIPESFIAYEV